MMEKVDKTPARRKKSGKRAVSEAILRQFLGGAALLAISLFMVPSIYAVLPAGLGVYMLSSAAKRWRGMRIEDKAFKRLSLPKDWTVTQSHPVPGHGDIDILVCSPEGAKYAIEIKSHRKVSYRKAFLGFGGKLIFQGAKPPKCPIKQVVGAAKRVDAHPILWFPEADTNKRISIKGEEPFDICFGSWRNVRKAVGAPGWWWF